MAGAAVMALPWMRILDAAIGIIDLTRSRRIRAMTRQRPLLAEGDPVTGDAGNLREEFERERLQLLRDRAAREEAVHQRAELAAKQEQLRQAGDREIGRLRLIAGVSVAAWLGTLLLATLHVHVTGVGPRLMLGVGWLLLLAAIAASFTGQANVARTLDTIASGDERALRRGVSSGITGHLAVWMIIGGLAFAGLAILAS
jgi:hypothetical protein